MKLEIAVAIRRNQKKWPNKKVMWDTLVEKLSVTQRTNETFKEYLSATKTIQSSIKDVGGFVGGYLNGGKRSSTTVRHRQIVTLDIDDCSIGMDEGLVDLITKGIPYELVIYSTHKHSPEKPRLRIVFPLDRPVSPDEYEAISRYLAGEVNIEHFDPTTFQPERFMYWPSTSSDGDYFYSYEWGPICCADDILANYVDWKDMSAWPRLSTEVPEIMRESKQLGEPTEKEGVVGAFCRAYNTEEAIEKFLPNVYEEMDKNRYTYLDGSSAGGAIIYNNGAFIYSHHSTDPAGGKLLNAFDLVRIHKFGGLDSDSEAPMSKRESFRSMCDFALKDHAVTAELDDVERPLSKALYTEFADELVEEDWLGGELDNPDDIFTDSIEELNLNNVPDFYKPDFKAELPGGINEENWKDKLERTKKGDIESKITNLKLILMFDPDLKGKIAMNDFEHCIYVTGSLPWDSSKELRRWNDSDEAGLRELVETKYDVYHISKITDALVLTATYNRFHPVKEFLSNLEWDGVPRLDTLFIDYLGAEDTPYTRAVTRKAFTAAVARIMRPGCKFDYVLTLVGDEGLKKSSLLNEMGGRWFSDSFTTVDGTKAYEQLQGSWLIEIAELSAFNRAETNSIKAFVTKRHDKFRGAYMRNVMDWPRQSVFFATTNEFTFLKGSTGNRRFWPIKVTKRFTGNPIAEKSGNGAEMILGLPVQQLWGEAIHYYKKGEKLYLNDELEVEAKMQQELFSESDDRQGIIERYLDILLPKDWNDMCRLERQEYMKDAAQYSKGTERRNFVCVNEIWEECLNMPLKDLNNYKAKDVINIMKKIAGWERRETRRNFPPYGGQRYFARMDVKEIFKLP